MLEGFKWGIGVMLSVGVVGIMVMGIIILVGYLADKIRS
jgi:hypothetical protein